MLGSNVLRYLKPVYAGAFELVTEADVFREELPLLLGSLQPDGSVQPLRAVTPLEMAALRTGTYSNGVLTRYFTDGRLHRANDLPAVVDRLYRWKEYWVDGLRHRAGDLPAVSWTIGNKTHAEYWLHGARTRAGGRPTEICTWHFGPLAGWLPRNYPDETTTHKEQIWHDTDGKTHRDGDLPAVVSMDLRGDRIGEAWFFHGLLHRTTSNKPAEWRNFRGRQKFEKWTWAVNGVALVEVKVPAGRWEDMVIHWFDSHPDLCARWSRADSCFAQNSVYLWEAPLESMLPLLGLNGRPMPCQERSYAITKEARWARRRAIVHCLLAQEPGQCGIVSFF